MVTAPRSVLTALALGCAVGLGVASRGAAQSALPNGSLFLPAAGAADGMSVLNYDARFPISSGSP